MGRGQGHKTLLFGFFLCHLAKMLPSHWVIQKMVPVSGGLCSPWNRKTQVAEPETQGICFSHMISRVTGHLWLQLQVGFLWSVFST